MARGKLRGEKLDAVRVGLEDEGWELCASFSLSEINLVNRDL
jgi:hypothetical protein